MLQKRHSKPENKHTPKTTFRSLNTKKQKQWLKTLWRDFAARKRTCCKKDIRSQKTKKTIYDWKLPFVFFCFLCGRRSHIMSRLKHTPKTTFRSHKTNKANNDQKRSLMFCFSLASWSEGLLSCLTSKMPPPKNDIPQPENKQQQKRLKTVFVCFVFMSAVGWGFVMSGCKDAPMTTFQTQKKKKNKQRLHSAFYVLFVSVVKLRILCHV